MTTNSDVKKVMDIISSRLNDDRLVKKLSKDSKFLAMIATLYDQNTYDISLMEFTINYIDWLEELFMV
jgi:hypothetical protein